MIRSTSRAKRATARMYRAWQPRAPDAVAREALALIASDEASHARALDGLVGLLSLSPPLWADPPVPENQPVSGPDDDAWPSALMAAFALDQAATSCLIALGHARHRNLREISRSIAEDEVKHQRFVLDTFRALVDATPALGKRLATEMLVARDWVHDIYPRRGALSTLVARGVLPAEAPKAHDSFLASLGDRMQDALGVLGC